MTTRACVLLAAIGCSTTYQPRPSDRIGVVIRYGGASYVKNDRLYPIGPLGGDLPALVAGNPEATRLARRARTDLAVGVPAYLVGVAAVVLGLLVRKPMGWGFVGGGVGVGASGLALMGAGFLNAIDAVNVHNDAVGDGRR